MQFKNAKEAKRFLDLEHGIDKSTAKQKELYENKEWYTCRALLGNDWANWFLMIGAKERGKTFTVQEYVLRSFFNPKSKLYHEPFYWWRLNDAAVKTMLMNNGAKMFEPILVRRFGLENIKVKGDTVYCDDVRTGQKNIKLCYVWGLSTAYNNKGTAVFDAEKFKGVNIIVDECALERGQRKTFDVCYNLKVQVDTVVRHERKNVKIFFMMNNTQECPEVVAMFGFMPINFGIYKLKRKHCVIDYIPNTAAYNKKRKDALSNEIDTGTGNFTNQVKRDLTLIKKGRLYKPDYIIKFTEDSEDWFTVWDGNVICRYHNEKRAQMIAMRRHAAEVFNTQLRDNIIELYDARSFKFHDILTQTLFIKNMKDIKQK